MPPETGDTKAGESTPTQSKPLVAKRTSETVRFATGLIALAIVLFLVIGFYTAGPDGVIPVMTLLLIRSLVTTIFAVVACFAVGAIFGVSFGLFRDAVIKLSAIAMTALAISTAVALFWPLLGLAVTFVLVVGLLKTLFDLDAFEVAAIVVVQLAVQQGVTVAIDRLYAG